MLTIRKGLNFTRTARIRPKQLIDYFLSFSLWVIIYSQRLFNLFKLINRLHCMSNSSMTAKDILFY